MTADELAELKAAAEEQLARCDRINSAGLLGEHYPVTVPHKTLLALLAAAEENAKLRNKVEVLNQTCIDNIAFHRKIVADLERQLVMVRAEEREATA